MVLGFFRRTLPRPAPSFTPNSIFRSIFVGGSSGVFVGASAGKRYNPGSGGTLDAYLSSGYCLTGGPAVGGEAGGGHPAGRPGRRGGSIRLRRIQEKLDDVVADTGFLKLEQFFRAEVECLAVLLDFGDDQFLRQSGLA